VVSAVKPRRLVVLGTLASDPWAGMAWMHMQIAAGLLRLGHDVSYFEVTSEWPYDPSRQSRVQDSDRALAYLAATMESFGFGGRWAYRRSYSDGEWFGFSRERAEALLLGADAVLNVSGATLARSKERLRIGRLVYLGTDPGVHELTLGQSEGTRALIGQHDDFATYGENIGEPDCPIPPLPGLKSRTRQPVLLDLWESGAPSRNVFTTVGNWKQAGRDVPFGGEVYRWSKHHEFLKFLDLPGRVDTPIELAMGLPDAAFVPDPDDPAAARLLLPAERRLLEEHGWRLVDAHAFSTDPWRYREYLRQSRGEFTVAKDLNVRLRSGWFSERSACYLAAGRPVITQDTGFGKILPTGEGLFAFQSMDEIVAAFEAVNADYERHSRAARAIAEEYFRAETVLARMLSDLGL
jgi:hypothetical protein